MNLPNLGEVLVKMAVQTRFQMLRQSHQLAMNAGVECHCGLTPLCHGTYHEDVHDMLHDIGWSSDCHKCEKNCSKLAWMFGWPFDDYYTGNITLSNGYHDYIAQVSHEG